MIWGKRYGRLMAYTTIIISLLLAMHLHSETTPISKTIQGSALGQKIPNFSLADRDGTKKGIWEILDGKSGFLYFYSGCCGHCNTQLKKVSPIVKNYRDNGVSVAGIEYLGSQKSCHINAKEFGLVGPILADEGGKICGSFGIGDFTVLTVNKDGVIRLCAGWQERLAR